MKDYPGLEGFVDQDFGELNNGSSEIDKPEVTNGEDRYEVQVARNGGEGQARLVLQKKGNGRPVPIVSVNTISNRGNNLLYWDGRMDYPDRVIRNVT